MRLSPPNFHGYEPGPDFDQARSLIRTPFQYLDISLTTALTNEIFNVSGDFLYVDAASTGTATLELNNQYNDPAAPFQISAGFGLNAIFKQVKITASAQPGKRLRLMYSTGDRIVPTNSTTISGAVTVNDNGYSYTNAYKSVTPMAANTPDTIIAPGANLNGAIVWNGGWTSYTGTFNSVQSFVSKSAAPATAIDGDVIAILVAPPAAAGYPGCGRVTVSTRIPAGLGLYYMTSGAETSGIRYCNYSLL